MGDSENPECPLPDDEGNVVGKHTQVDAAIPAWPQTVQIGMIRDPQDARVHSFLNRRPKPARASS